MPVTYAINHVKTVKKLLAYTYIYEILGDNFTTNKKNLLDLQVRKFSVVWEYFAIQFKYSILLEIWIYNKWEK